ncbi:ATP-dependent RecD-like DNA helicase [Synergistales bacterium]|nr:ATP-dependent RecD-like DNA helicase [Synergistales bacterium]GHV50528.1 ATP-dependent RecD-like DNA helicase [Synergistales bacterium]
MTESIDAETVRGTLERVTYFNEENGYSVLKIDAGEDDLASAVGYTDKHVPGEELEMTGTWTLHPRYGRQFTFTSCKSLLPSTVEGIKRFLGSGRVKGIGPRLAERIVDSFGEETFDVLDALAAENETADKKEAKKAARLRKKFLAIQGISERILDSVKQTWAAEKNVRAVMYFLESSGVSPKFAVKIYGAYGDETIKAVSENPYRLADDMFGVGFLSADKVARGMGMEDDSPLRLDAGVKYVLGELVSEGHVYAPRDVLEGRASALLGAGSEAVSAAIDRAIERREFVLDIITGNDNDTQAVYLPAFYVSETKSARKLAAMLRAKELTDLSGGADSEMAISLARDSVRIRLAPEQEEAIALAVRSKCMIVTGGPGTGKTTIIRAIISAMRTLGQKIELAAPTGRAAKRMSEATGRPARTIHRLLEFSAEENGFARNADNPLSCDLLIVDEASMIDAVLFFHLLRALRDGTKLILVGDICQLPSVGPGNVLGDLIDSGAVPVARLNKIFRQAGKSGIVRNAHRVNNGFMLETDTKTVNDKLRDFYFVDQDDPEKCARIILSLVRDRIPSRFGFDPIKDVQVLTPMHKGSLGSSRLNEELARALNPGDKPSVRRGSRVFKVGDKIMQIRNDYDKDVFNGDIGVISRAEPDIGTITAIMDGREVTYESESFDDIVHAYAVSIHKSQGSEYPAVVMPIHTQHYVLLQRNLLYTGITRGKKLVVIVGTKKAAWIAIQNDKTKERYTYLAERLKEAMAV